MPEHRFEHREASQQEAAHRHEERQQEGLEFATPEEAIRHDVENTIPPPEIAERLNQSLANEPKKETSFWSRIMGRK
jgi:hypothetical protein